MKKPQIQSFLLLGCLIALTCVALAYSKQDTPFIPDGIEPVTAKTGPVTLTGELTQDKILAGGDGTTALSLTLTAEEMPSAENREVRDVDMVIVLDRSGSMEGTKLNDAKRAVRDLLGRLSSKDRFALVSYSSGVQRHSGLVPVTASTRESLMHQINRVYSGGGTNLGAGLQLGINTLMEGGRTGNLGRVILVSDGLANEGITDTAALGNMAGIARKREFGISTVGVGEDFNEALMTAIADRGTGSYYYLSDPAAFASVFEKEFLSARATVASGLEIRVPLVDGVRLTHAAGYPIQIQDGHAVFYPGDLRSGDSRKLFLTLQVPAHADRSYEIRGLTARYRYQNEPASVTLSTPFRIACVKDEKTALSSIRRETWEKKVIQNDYNLLKEEVAADIRAGKPQAAEKRIQEYRTRQEAINVKVQSPAVAENLAQEVTRLEDRVKDTFAGAPSQVAEKQKRNAKALQFEGYQGRRDK